METLHDLITKLDVLYAELRDMRDRTDCPPDDIARIQLDTMLILGKMMCLLSVKGLDNPFFGVV
jgi:hypothetical protein